MSQLTDAVELLELTFDKAFANAKDEEQQKFVLDSLFLAMKGYSRTWKSNIPDAEKMLNDGCPPGWDSCPDGSCVPQGAGCGSGLNFVGNEVIIQNKNPKGETRLSLEQAKSMLSSYITAAAQDYFERSQTAELQQMTPMLLGVARLDFKNRVAPTLLTPSVEEPLAS